MLTKRLSYVIGLSALLTSLSEAGFYLGGQLGLSMLKGEHEYKNPEVTPAQTSNVALKGIGFGYGLQAGYLYEPNLKYFAFIEADALFGSPKLQKEFTDNVGTKIGSVNIKRSSTFSGIVGGGMRLNPLLGAYLKVGYEWSKYKVSYTNLSFSSDNKNPIYNKTLGTLTPGGGLIYTLTRSFFVKFEYSYSMSRNSTLRNGGVVAENVKRALDLSLGEHRLMAALNYHF